MKKIFVFIFMFLSLTACETVKEKTSGIKDMGSNVAKQCPPKEERTLKHIFCREPK